MKAFSIFDDFPHSSIALLEEQGISITLNPKGEERPTGDALKLLLNEYDVLFISTAQKMAEEMFKDVSTFKIIGTASSGVDHIHIPVDKRHLIKIANAPQANRRTVTEHTFGLILTLRKQLIEGRATAAQGLSKKAMVGKPVDLYGSTMGVIGAGGIASTVLRMAQCFGLNRLCWTLHPENHKDLSEEGVLFVDIDTLLKKSDIVSVNLPLSLETKNLITQERVELLKETATFITTSRLEISDNKALMEKAKRIPTFSVGMDVDAVTIKELWNPAMNNVIVTPHIGGGTIESRLRLFNECTGNVIKIYNNERNNS